MDDASDVDEDSTNENTEIFTQEDFEDKRTDKKDHTLYVSSPVKESADHGTTTKSDSQNDSRLANDNDNDDDDENNENKEDDGESSVDSLSSSQSASSLSSMASTDSEASLTLMQRQARNIARNERFLGSLRKKYEGQLGDKEQQEKKQQQSKGDGRQQSAKRDTKDASLKDDEESCVRDEENLGMVNNKSHRLFRFPFRREALPKPVLNSNTEVSSMFRAYHNYASGIQILKEKYPHREVQIAKLHSILSSTASLTASASSKIVPSSAASVYVPAPIFCMGPPGTAKTSIVCDVLGFLSARDDDASSSKASISFLTHQAKVQPAYVDCSIVEPSTIERLVYTIYKQLKPSYSASVSEERKRSRANKARRKRKPNKKPKRSITTFRLSPPKSQPKDDSNTETDDAQQQHSSIKVDETNQQPRVLPSRKAKKAAIHKSLANNATTYKNLQRQRLAGESYDFSDDEDDEDDSDDENVTTLHSAVLSLGRSLQKHYGSYLDDNGAYNNKSFRKKPKCGILVLDKAEELLSLSSASKKGTSASTGAGANNFLSELLLLPKIMKLNLTIVVITNYCTLHMTRLNNASDPSKALGTISNGVHPIIVQFPAYKGNKMFTEVLSTVENQKLVMGNSLSPNAASIMRQTLKDKLVRAFWNTVVQFVSDSTRDIRDFQKLGRALWPSFVAPLHPLVLRTTLTAVANKLGVGISGLTKEGLSDPQRYTKIEDEIVRILGNKFYPMVSSLASGDDSLTLLMLNEDGSLPLIPFQPSHNGGGVGGGGRIVQTINLGSTLSVPQPYLRSCLLLAAFVCQHNKADQDRKLFSVHGNGKRRKSRAKEDLYGGNDEDLAFGSTNTTLHSSGRGRKGKQDGQPRQVEMLRSLKLRPVPLERVFSIFVTLVRLNPGYGGIDEEKDNQEGLEATMEDLGSSRLYRDLWHLVDLGYLQLTKGNQTMSLAPTRILCTLTKEEALEISNRIHIPLERYLI